MDLDSYKQPPLRDLCDRKAVKQVFRIRKMNRIKSYLLLPCIFDPWSIACIVFLSIPQVQGNRSYQGLMKAVRENLQAGNFNLAQLSLGPLSSRHRVSSAPSQHVHFKCKERQEERKKTEATIKTVNRRKRYLRNTCYRREVHPLTYMTPHLDSTPLYTLLFSWWLLRENCCLR